MLHLCGDLGQKVGGVAGVRARQSRLKQETFVRRKKSGIWFVIVAVRPTTHTTMSYSSQVLGFKPDTTKRPTCRLTGPIRQRESKA
jgi:hypothetical protein